MSFCSGCGASCQDDARFCTSCGESLAPDMDATVPTPVSSGEPSAGRPGQSTPRTTPPRPTPPRTTPPPVSRSAARTASGPPPSSPSADGTYAPGTLVADRYRIVAMLGKGGMGEVYRADDLTLGQSVALKFLPDDFAGDPERRELFHKEVRTAREVAHPNVCRVYDIGEVDGRDYLSMEYIDGEDLSSLLRRIGRLPQEKAVEIARQLCAGLGALHDRGVLHRDLKPANVMIDGRGRVRITDFGLSGIAEEIVGADARAGTPAYMAPEQLSGERADGRSDIYALGLILYEVFTGKRAFEADSIADLSRMQRESTPTSVSTLLPDLDPAVERVVMRCLEHDPERRPPSAFAVAAALPGGDPLAAALAAGEIPSIEMVAAAGKSERMRPLLAWLCMAAVVAGIVLHATVGVRGSVHWWDLLEKPAPVLVDHAREILTHVGWDSQVDEMFSFGRAGDVLRWIAENDSSSDRWERLRDRPPTAIRFWYRSSPTQLIPLSPDALRSFNDPPQTVAGMARMTMDSSGRLLFLEGVPPQSTGDAEEGDSVDSGVAAADWDYLIAAAGFDPASLAPADPEWLPASYADDRRAWTGTLPGEPDTEIRIEGASQAGRPVFFQVIGPWTQPSRQAVAPSSGGDLAVEATLILLLVAIMAGIVALAVHNVKTGRGDKTGARRLSIFVFAVVLGAWVLTANHAAAPSGEINMFFAFLAQAIFVAGLFWTSYLALEPFVRRTWPERIVGWSRLLTGRWRDSLVGRDILVGGVFFLVLIAFNSAELLTYSVMSVPSPLPSMADGDVFLGVGSVLAVLINAVINAIFNSMFFFLVLLLLRLLLRKQSIAIAVLLALFALFGAFTGSGDTKLTEAMWALLTGALFITVLLRLGLLVFVVGFFFRLLISGFPTTLDSSAWYAGTSYFGMFVLMAITMFGLWAALSNDQRVVVQDTGGSR